MKVKQQKTGIFHDGKEIVAVELYNKAGNFVRILNLGAIIQQFVVKNAHGQMQDIVLGFDEVGGYLSAAYMADYPYLGSIIGRYANRIKNGRFELDGRTYQLAQNADGNCLHGGMEGFDRKIWDIVSCSGEPHATVVFQYMSQDGEEHFPGNLRVSLRFEFTDKNELILSYEAQTDAATPVNLTHHSYFNLSPDGDKIMNHIHRMPASHYLEQDEGWNVTGKQLPVTATIHDFRTARAIAENWNGDEGYDQSYVLDKEYGSMSVASVTCEKESGLCLTVHSREPIAHFYTAKYLAVKNGKNGKNYGAFDAFCIETQHHPNGLNIPHFPSTILLPGETYRQTTVYEVSYC